MYPYHAYTCVQRFVKYKKRIVLLNPVVHANLSKCDLYSSQGRYMLKCHV